MSASPQMISNSTTTYSGLVDFTRRRPSIFLSMAAPPSLTHGRAHSEPFGMTSALSLVRKVDGRVTQRGFRKSDHVIGTMPALHSLLVFSAPMPTTVTSNLTAIQNFKEGENVPEPTMNHAIRSHDTMKSTITWAAQQDYFNPLPSRWSDRDKEGINAVRVKGLNSGSITSTT